jgi:hypothetical protein
MVKMNGLQIDIFIWAILLNFGHIIMCHKQSCNYSHYYSYRAIAEVVATVITKVSAKARTRVMM